MDSTKNMKLRPSLILAWVIAIAGSTVLLGCGDAPNQADVDPPKGAATAPGAPQGAGGGATNQQQQTPQLNGTAEPQ